MLKWTVAGKIDRMGRVANPEARKHQLIPQNCPYMNTILEISLALIESDQGLSQSQLCVLPRA